MQYADGKTKEFYQAGMSANKSGISVYILGIEDKKLLTRIYSERLGKAGINGYCINFKTLTDINTNIFEEAIRYGFEATH